MFEFKKTENKTRKKTYTAFGVPTTFWALWNIIKNVEIGLSFNQQIGGIGMITIDILVPLIIGLVLVGACWLWFEFKDTVSSYIERIDKLENKIAELKNQDEKHRQIENNHILQVHINSIIARILCGELENKNYLNAFLYHHGDSLMYKFIQTNNSSLSDDDAKKISDFYENEEQQFQKPIS